MSGAGRVHFIGVGGAGMSAIAVVLLARGVQVSGSDLKESRNTRRLRQMGARIHIGHRPENVEDAGMVVVSSAIPERNVELSRAREKGLEIIPRAAMLGRIMEEGKGIAVAGTHGKTTTTSMLAMILREAGLDPTYVVGGELNDVGSNAHAGQGEYVVAEADESDGSFLLLRPWAAVVTNLEEDHLDYFASREAIVEHFRRFVSMLPEGGLLVLNGDDPGAAAVLGHTRAREVTFGTGADCTYRCTDICLLKGRSQFVLRAPGGMRREIQLRVPGRHNVLNATAALALALSMGVDADKAARALRRFGGVQRRFQEVESVAGVRLVDDYAHHPSEVLATLEAARNEGAERVVCIFQPHRYTRTASLWEEFGRALALADVVMVTDVYSAGEEPLPGVNGKLIVNAILDADPARQVVYLPQRSTLGEGAASFLRPGDLVLTMGAGDVSQCAAEIATILREKGEKARGEDR
ncbi:MAG: UDP-N-acetylmuramate--L-alanine ligase [Actinobacteria bacterium]|nr:UDP-N-acetylmuramate--L-alanine ligase [Actinomycetota bacterium]